MRRFSSAREGHTAIEYAMIAGFVALLLITSISLIGSTVDGWFDSANAGFAASR
ncbi:MAG TPA: Flp family type IVb pilin [Caulobacterales bacterium]|nr:Flp family type IVb pilin [Caulobacterales bacterium]